MSSARVAVTAGGETVEADAAGAPSKVREADTAGAAGVAVTAGGETGEVNASCTTSKAR